LVDLARSRYPGACRREHPAAPHRGVTAFSSVILK
jgi:hypothetical protein